MKSFCFAKFLYPLPLLRLGALLHFTPNMEQLICELMTGNLDRIIIRRAGCLILSTVFTKDLMLSALVTYSNSNESFICFFKGFCPGSVF